MKGHFWKNQNAFISNMFRDEAGDVLFQAHVIKMQIFLSVEWLALCPPVFERFRFIRYWWGIVRICALPLKYAEL